MALAADIDTSDEEPAKKKSKLPLIIGLVLALVGAGAGFMITRMGLLPGTSVQDAEEVHPASAPITTEDVTFIPLDPITVTLPPGSGRTLLRLSAQLDVAPENAEHVTKIMPRIIDILNSYLRAVQMQDLDSPTALLRLRVQMLHRVQVVAGQGVVRDLLITEFILN